MDALTLVELQALEADYWFEVDHHLGRAAMLAYEPDGTFTIGATIFRGRAEIAGFYRRREERGARTARHAIANPRFERAGDGEGVVSLQYIMLLYADDGVPVLEAKAPVMIADVTSEYVRGAGSWLVRARTLRPIFEGGAGAIKT